MVLPTERELPPKSHLLLSQLKTQKTLLTLNLSSCIRQNLCINFEGAKDYLRAYVCSIFDSLWEYYDSQINVFDYQVEIANEAIRNVLFCWENMSVLIRAETWTVTLQNAITQHTGRAIWRPVQVDTRHPTLPSPPSPVEVPPSQTQPAMPSIATELRQLLDEAKLKPEDVPEHMQIDWRTVYRHLAGEITPSRRTVWAYENMLEKRLGKKITLPKSPAKRQNVSKMPAKRQ